MFKKTIFSFLSIIPIILIFAPAFARADGGLSFSEIMYDVPGTDTGREWVEVQNSSASAIDLTTASLQQGGSKHGISANSGGSVLSAGDYAIIASDPNKFLIDWPNFSGKLF